MSWFLRALGNAAQTGGKVYGQLHLEQVRRNNLVADRDAQRQYEKDKLADQRAYEASQRPLLAAEQLANEQSRQKVITENTLDRRQKLKDAGLDGSTSFGTTVQSFTDKDGKVRNFRVGSDGSQEEVLEGLTPHDELAARQSAGSKTLAAKTDRDLLNQVNDIDRGLLVYKDISDVLNQKDFDSGAVNKAIDKTVGELFMTGDNAELRKLSALTKELALSNVGKLKGPLSDKDLQFVIDAEPNEGFTDEANLGIIKAKLAYSVETRRRLVEERRFIAKNGNTIGYEPEPPRSLRSFFNDAAWNELTASSGQPATTPDTFSEQEQSRIDALLAGY